MKRRRGNLQELFNSQHLVQSIGYPKSGEHQGNEGRFTLSQAGGRAHGTAKHQVGAVEGIDHSGSEAKSPQGEREGKERIDYSTNHTE